LKRLYVAGGVRSLRVIAQCGPPPLVYSQPATRFVASFLGTTNLLRARIVARNGSSATVVLDSGAEAVQLAVPATLGAGDWSATFWARGLADVSPDCTSATMIRRWSRRCG
jgi:ABC-type sulfate/molybdate transport systems ATPase subunit